MKALLLVPVLMLVPVVVAGQIPTVSDHDGVLSAGGTVTLYGSGFGVKSQAAPLRWDDFQDGTPGDWLVDRSQPGGGIWDLQQTGPAPYVYDRWPQYSSGRQRYPGDISALQAFHHADDPAAGAEYTSANRSIAVIDQPSRIWYASMWVYQDDYAGNALFTDNAKLYGHFAYSHWSQVYPQMRWDEYWYQRGLSGQYDDSPWSLAGGHISWTDCNTNAVDVPRIGPVYRDNRGRWVRIERFLDVGDPGAGNSYLAGYRDLELVRGGGNLMNPAGCPDTAGSFFVGHFFRPRMSDGSAGGDGLVTYAAMNQYISELYVDHTFARVEIGNAAQWDDCTHREIQIPTSWVDGEITFTARTNVFNDGEDVWAFVVDANNVPSAGYPLVVNAIYEGPGTPGQPIRDN